MKAFASALIEWQRAHGRHDLPWQDTRDPYAIWLSEIMLQQTQVATVIPYYQRFRARFPDIASLAQAPEDDVLSLWAGLGYYSRVRNLHRAAQLIMERHGGAFPRCRADIEALPGIGRSTAAAIAGFAFGARSAILDGNVKRVLTRHFDIEGYPGERAIEQRLWALAETLMPAHESEIYIQGLMDLGATLCTTRKPACERCPLQFSCAAYAQNRVGLLPTPKPKKTMPLKSTAMLVLLHGADVLLQKRPAIGIWGGLWSFPETDDATQSSLIAERVYGCTLASSERLGVLRHSFTHFHLDITPMLLRVTARASRAEQPGVLWMNIDDALNGALPTPAKKILRALRGSSAADQSALFEEALQNPQAQ